MFIFHLGIINVIIIRKGKLKLMTPKQHKTNEIKHSGFNQRKKIKVRDRIRKRQAHHIIFEKSRWFCNQAIL